MTELFLILGSNLGDREGYINSAIELIKVHLGKIDKKSPLYETQAWGSGSEMAYLNMVVVVRTNLRPEIILSSILGIEKELGRERNAEKRYDDRVIDIDMLFYGNSIINSEKLTLPHSRIAERKFVLVPLFEVAAEFIHPVLNKKIRELLDECTDKMWVRKTEL